MSNLRVPDKVTRTVLWKKLNNLASWNGHILYGDKLNTTSMFEKQPMPGMTNDHRPRVLHLPW